MASELPAERKTKIHKKKKGELGIPVRKKTLVSNKPRTLSPSSQLSLTRQMLKVQDVEPQISPFIFELDSNLNFVIVFYC